MVKLFAYSRELGLDWEMYGGLDKTPILCYIESAVLAEKHGLK